MGLTCRFKLITGDGGVPVNLLRLFNETGQVDVAFHLLAKIQLCLLTFNFEPRERSTHLRDVDAVLFFELLRHVLDKGVVKVFSAEMVVTASRDDLVLAIFDLNDRDVESAASEIEDKHVAIVGLSLLLEAISKGSGRGFVDHAEDIESGDVSSVSCCLSLSVGEVGWNRDNAFGNRVAKVFLG